ncbi:MAG: CRISPR-associated endonuclease Cas1 [Pirellulales bacterium]|nr:CRISPR-associated endonuclease Cas1 [Pirellulales bacterium]
MMIHADTSPAPSLPDESPPTDYLPARMVNEFVYCPRLFYLMHVEGQFAESYETIDGQIVHRRVDSGNGSLDAATTTVDDEQTIPLPDMVAAAEAIEEPTAPRPQRSKHVQPATLFADPSDEQDPQATPESAERESGQAATLHARSVTLSHEDLGVIAKMDLIEACGQCVTPVDYKRGKPKQRPGGGLDAWPPEKIQLALQALVLRDNGYQCQEGILYFNTTRQRVHIPIDDSLIDQAIAAVRGARHVFDVGKIPAPLVNSPKCAKCSLVNLCLPDETRALMRRTSEPIRDGQGGFADSAAKSKQSHLASPAGGRSDDGKLGDSPAPVRPIITARDERRPLYFNQQGLRISKKGDVLMAKVDGKVVQQIRVREINQINLFGNVQVSTQAIQNLLHHGIPIGYFTQRGWFYGVTHSLGVKNILVRREQFRRADDAAFCLNLAKQLVRSKIRNSRTLLMRNHVTPSREVVRELKRLAQRVDRSDSPASLLGMEGTAARIYFGQFSGMLKVGCDVETAPGSALSERRGAFDFRGRNRRPPRDPVNALLSLAYSLLTKDCLIAASAVGLDPYLGFYHQVKPGKPALALDVMEPFRPLVAESVVLSAINNRMVTPDHFLVAGKSVVLNDAGRKHFLMAYEQRMDTLVTHPLFDYRVSYRRVLEIQTRLLARLLTGEILEYPVFETR